MIYCIDPTAEEPIMLLNKHIGFDEEDGMGIDGSIFQQELLQLDSLNKKRIQVWINSPGGVVTDGYSIYSAILKSNTPVDTYCVGAAASIAGVIFQAGRKRIMADYAWLMYHNPFDVSGKKDKTLETMRDSIIKMIAQRCGMTESDVSDMMNRTTYILADEALKMKLCDSIDESKAENTKYLRKISDSLQFHKECNKILNSLINKPNLQTNMIKVCMRLGLNDSAPEDSIVKAIDAIENRAKKAEDELDKAKNEADEDKKKAESEADKLKAKIKQLEEDKKKADDDLEDCKSKLKALEEDKKKAEDEAEDKRAEDKIRNFAKIGRIKNEEAVILQWKTTAKKIGLDETCNMIEALPINKAAVVIPVANELEDGAIPTTALGLSVKNRLKRQGKL